MVRVKIKIQELKQSNPQQIPFNSISRKSPRLKFSSSDGSVIAQPKKRGRPKRPPFAQTPSVVIALAQTPSLVIAQPKKRGRPKKPPLAQTPSVVSHARTSYNDTPIEVVATNKGSEEETRVDVVSRINEGPSFEFLSQNMLIASDEVDVKSNKKSTSQFNFVQKEAKIPKQEDSIAKPLVKTNTPQTKEPMTVIKKPDISFKGVFTPSIWLKSPYKNPYIKKEWGEDWKDNFQRRCPFHYAKDDPYLKTKFMEWLSTDCNEQFRVGGVLQSGNFFQELADSTSDLSDEHIDVCLYYLRKKYCYHVAHFSDKIKCTTTDTIFNGTVEIVKLFKKHDWFVENSSEEQMTNYARGLQISALTSWSYVYKILLPMRLSPTKNESESTHYVLGVLDLRKKVIDLYDSISDKKYGRRSMALAKTYGRLLPDLLKALCLKDEHPSYANDVKVFSVVRKEDVPKQPGAVECGVYMLKFISLIMEDGSIDNFKADEINEWRIELAANLWQHCMWKKETGYATPEENGYDDYGDNEVNMCPFDL
ncbi:hypothetical protein BC332_33943 [Capsicum chinense]|nr:hypothetical protein BC332_33943 [Capsicum chinense]